MERMDTVEIWDWKRHKRRVSGRRFGVDGLDKAEIWNWKRHKRGASGRRFGVDGLDTVAMKMKYASS